MSVTISIWSSIKSFIQARINLSRLTFVSRLPQLLYFKSAECHFFSVGKKKFSTDIFSSALIVVWSNFELICDQKKKKSIWSTFTPSYQLSYLISWSKLLSSLFCSRICLEDQINVKTDSSVRNYSSQKYHVGIETEWEGSPVPSPSSNVCPEHPEAFVQPALQHLLWRRVHCVTQAVWSNS